MAWTIESTPCRFLKTQGVIIQQYGWYKRCSSFLFHHSGPRVRSTATSLLGVKAVSYPANAARSTNVCQSRTNPWLVLVGKIILYNDCGRSITKQKHRDYGQFVVP